MSSFGQRLRQLRLQHGLTQTAFGHFFNMKKFRISQYELGKRQADDEFKKDCALFFNVSLDYLMGLTDTPRSLHLGKERNVGEKIYKQTLPALKQFFQDQTIPTEEKDQLMQEVFTAYLQGHRQKNS